MSDEDSDQSHRQPKIIEPVLESDPVGYLIAVSFTPPKDSFASYEIYNFIENTLKIELEDMSVFRNSIGIPTGIVVAQLTSEISLVRLMKLHGKKFKGSPVEARLFTTQASFQKFIFAQSEPRLQTIKLNYDNSVPLVYVQNFPEGESDLGDFFSQCGKIISIKKYPFKKESYYAIEFSTEAEARLVCRTFNDYELHGRSLKVAILYKNAAERSFAVHHCQDIQWLKNELKCYGRVDAYKVSNDVVYVMMETLESSKAACILLNKNFDTGTQIVTHFIDYEYFNRVK
ncbi:hypothetical protein TRFO_17927 [Tritrichomonas foetus]|uniref:RRM domain-containing protein n=1 Tax=Tritrichomonas foetus TaxID=1144522 RepID=A0A1J4KLZ4_9EUKA|nr:hypothetical protein TRFO_17927 [Tritrichomonas foetus]|eukprot:OHT12335.1 hypothetical protein TRFO_17927 [Tritrichomonas foetus]